MRLGRGRVQENSVGGGGLVRRVFVIVRVGCHG